MKEVERGPIVTASALWTIVEAAAGVSESVVYTVSLVVKQFSPTHEDSTTAINFPPAPM